MNLNKIIRLYKRGNVTVCGLRGTGKDMLQGNVIVRRAVPYISNINYTGDKTCKLKNGDVVKMFQPLEFDKLDCGKNNFVNWLSGKPNRYIFPYIEGSDVYLSDAGIYLPAQDFTLIDRKYPYISTYCALSRQVSVDGNCHSNSQSLERVFSKWREQSDIFIRCRFCKVLFGKLVIQKVTLYDKYQSCVDRVEPCKIRVPSMSKREVKENAKMYLDKYRCTYGTIKNHLLIYWNKSTYDTYYFKHLLERNDLFEEGKKVEK
jgi:hypothetical protein